MSEVPKLYPNKPKKAHLKLLREEHPESSAFASASPAMSSSMPPGNLGGAPLPQPPKESFARRYKFMWPLLLAVNFTAGAYLFMRTRKSGEDVKGEDPSFPSASVPIKVPAAKPSDPKPPSPPPLVVEPPKPREPIPISQQQELFKWMLEEKRRMEREDALEKRKIEEDKALLKQFIRSKSTPDL